MVDRNRLIHIFGNPRHNLGPLVKQFGSEEAAFQAMQDAVDAALTAGKIAIDGLGVYSQVFDVEGNVVTMAGVIIGNEARIGTAWMS